MISYKIKKITMHFFFTFLQIIETNIINIAEFIFMKY